MMKNEWRLKKSPMRFTNHEIAIMSAATALMVGYLKSLGEMDHKDEFIEDTKQLCNRLTKGLCE